VAKIEYIAPINSLTGKLGGCVFQKNKSGYIIRSKEYGKKTRTEKQELQRTQFSSIKKRWNTIGSTNQGLWNDFAAVHNHTDKYTKVLTLTGFQWFMSLNRNCFTNKAAYIDTPPDYSLPQASPEYYLTITETDLELTLDAPISLNDTDLFVFASYPTNRESGQVRRKMRLITVLKAGPYNTVSILGVYNAAFSNIYPPAGKYWDMSIFIELVPIHNVSFINGISRNFNTHVLITNAGFTPIDIPSCILWLDGTSIIQSGNLISAWNDKSGAGNNFTQSNEEYKPLYVVSGLNGKPLARFNGSSNFLNGGNILNVGTDDISIFFVLKFSTTIQMWFSKSTPASVGYYYYYASPNTGAVCANAVPALTLFNKASYNTPNTYQIHNFFSNRDSGKSYFLKDNVQQWDFDIVNPANEQINSENCLIGAWREGSYYLNGDVAEIIIYNRTLTTDERTQIYNYLHAKYFE
jgi:hypothetical protein